MQKILQREFQVWENAAFKPWRAYLRNIIRALENDGAGLQGKIDKLKATVPLELVSHRKSYGPSMDALESEGMIAPALPPKRKATLPHLDGMAPWSILGGYLDSRSLAWAGTQGIIKVAVQRPPQRKEVIRDVR
ncbi:hypothetical protein B0T16DRAFT_385063 [Cercophora newfieldiana]|uniref:Uncharacterized protein n=1 Tax=Cercophora newfieldiana TaxID=92897 RepID=A0AA39YQL8_9PEZI|nr:hypothetical protein B0T16DRAFT_385063 [Cercophora newfieldiana]